MTTAGEASRIHQALIDQLVDAGTLSNPAVEAAFRAVPRHLFLPDVPLAEVYRDQAIVTKHIDGIRVSSSSQPSIMAIMLQQLDVQPGQRVLEIGAGTGYNAALLAHLVGHTGQVVSIDIDPDIVESAQQHLAAGGFDRVQVIRGDGGLGHLAGVPYDRIILTVGAWDVAPAWWEQLRADGRLVLPLALRGAETQRSIAFDRVDDHLVSNSVRPCGFMLLRGAFAGPIQQVPLGPAPGLLLVHEQTVPVDATAVFGWLGTPGATCHASVRVNSLAAAGALTLWLALRDRRFCAVRTEAAELDTPFAAEALYGHGWQIRTTVGLLGERGLALLGRSQDALFVDDADEWAADAPPFGLEVRNFGVDDGIAEDLLELVQGWDVSGRPNGDTLRVKVYPRGVGMVAEDAEHVITKQWSQILLDWTSAHLPWLTH